MTNKTDTKSDAIIDLDADQVIDHEDVVEVQEKATEQAAKKPNRNWLYGVAALAAAAVGGGWVYKDFLSGYFPSDQVQALSEKVVVLESKNETLRSQLAAVEKLTTQLTSDVDALEGKEQSLSSFAEASQKNVADTATKLQGLEQALAETKQALADIAVRPVTGATGVAIDAALQQRVATLEKDVASLKVKPTEPVDNTAALSQNMADLKAKIAAGAGYREEYERIQRMVPAAEGLDTLALYAALGIPNAQDVALELQNIIPELPKPAAAEPSPASEGWWDGIYRSLSDLITIKVEGEVDWPKTAAAAAAFAEAGDLPQAIEQLNAVEGAKPVDIQQWIDRAEARLSLEKAVQSVEEAVLRVIAAKG